MKKLSEMTTEELARMLTRLTQPVCSILEDERVAEMMKQAVPGEALMTSLSRAAKKILPGLMRDHAGALLEIAALLTGKTKKDIRCMNGMEALRLVRASMDGELMDFFGCAGIAKKKKF